MTRPSRNLQRLFFWKNVSGRVIPLLALLLLLSACAVVPVQENHLGNGAREWAAYMAYCGEREQDRKPFRLRGSVRFGMEENMHRATFLLWSNGGLPIRMDVLAGFNSVVARILETSDRFVAYSPLEKKALLYEGNSRIHLNLGKPLPFSPADLSLLMQGEFHKVFGPNSGDSWREGENFRFALAGRHVGNILDLRSDGLPVKWVRPGDWTLDIAYTEEIPPRPRRFEMSHQDGYRAIVLIKEREYPETVFSEEQLSLVLPEDTQLVPVRKAAY